MQPDINSGYGKVLAITGGIGSGKSIVSRCLKSMGIPVYDCDEEAKKLNSTDPDIRQGLISLVGTHVYRHDGTLDKAVLSDFLFTDPEHAQKVNAIIHPCVKSHFKQWVSMQHKPWVAIESAILYESGFQHLADAVVTVYTPIELRIKRAMNRDNASREAVTRRISCQKSDEEKIALADYVVYNDDKLPVLLQILDILANLLCKIR